MKNKNILGLILILSILFIILFSGCDLSYLGFRDNTKGALSININPNRFSSSRNISPETSMIPVKYIIMGTGPGNSKFEKELTGTSCSIYDLSIGNWRLSIIAYNENGDQIGWGESLVSVSPAITSETSVLVEPYSGNGSVYFIATWNSSEVSNPSISATLTDSSGTETVLQFETGTGTASYSQNNIPAGYYTLNIKLLDGETVVSGLVESVRVLNGFQTTGNFNFTNLNSPTGDISISVIVNLYDPFEPIINGAVEILAYGSNMTVSASVPDSESENMIYRWYVNGELTGTGESISFGNTLKWGYYRLDLVVTNENGTRSGSVSHMFTVE